MASAIESYARVFGFTEIQRWTGKDGRLHNAEMKVGDTELWLDGGGRHMLRRDGDGPIWIGIWVDDVDATYAKLCEAGVDAGAPVDRPFGVHMLSVTDPAGYVWGFMRRI